MGGFFSFLTECMCMSDFLIFFLRWVYEYESLTSILPYITSNNNLECYSMSSLPYPVVKAPV